MPFQSNIRPIKTIEFKEAIQNYTASQLEKEKSTIENAISHLQSSNKRMDLLLKKLQADHTKSKMVDEDQFQQEFGNEELVESNEDGKNTGNSEDIKLFEDSIKENEGVLYNYFVRLQAIRDEEEARLTSTKTNDGTITPATSNTTANPNNVFI
ncbi:Tma17p SCDLUD_002707 [Saccharomycodes ludwigii]|uniref:Tma17p n=1 Tax=Saccharomycodes ludwigii TaxID=36035 RepID=UPI001E8731F2|nr:hypothetical protein SCDLUD_002707 [Saccharomycodes ludwigii]KAH3901221.1 hypothetical protein SCDLUD_002707 [Saccharomycodes ludwigii]